MAVNPNKLSKFWQELKRRRVVHVTIVYASAAILIIDLIGNVTEPLHLPDWTPTLIIVLLAIGFPVALIFSWIFDVTPQGIEKTKTVQEEEGAGEHPVEKQKPVSNGWKIATYASLAVIVGLLVLHLFGGKSRMDKDLEKSLAILPVHNLSGDVDQEYICDGLTREIISQLYKIGSFDKVISYQTMNAYKNTGKSIPEIAEERGVNFVLDPSYIRMGDKMKVEVDLVNAKTDQPIWNDEYRMDYKEIISMPSDIAIKLAQNLDVFISGDEEKRIERKPTDNVEAFELVQKALNYFFSGPPWRSGFELRDTLEKAIELDPGYAVPYVLIATFSMFKYTGLGEPLHDFTPEEVIRYNYEGLRRDPENTGAILNQALYEQWVEWDYVESEAQFQKVFSIEPNTRFNYFIRSYIEFLFKMDRYEEIPVFMERLDEPHPREAQIAESIGQHEMAETIAKNSIAKGPLRTWTMEYFIWEGQYDVVRRVMDSIDMAHNDMYNLPGSLGYRAITYSQTGDPELARELVEQLKLYSEQDQHGMPELNLGRYFSVIGEVDSAFFWLEKAYAEHCVDMSWLRADKLLRKLDFDDRYWDLYERTGFKAYDEHRASLESGQP